MRNQTLHRVENLVITESDDDLLVYHPTSHTLHTLNAIAADVFRRCDGTTTRDDLVRDSGLSHDQVQLALHQLNTAELLQGANLTDVPSTTSRRRVLRSAGIAAAIPTIASVTAPLASAAQSVACTPSNGVCALNNPGACCSLTCINGNPPYCS